MVRIDRVGRRWWIVLVSGVTNERYHHKKDIVRSQVLTVYTPPGGSSGSWGYCDLYLKMSTPCLHCERVLRI
jgi:hypothetical protein